MLPSEERDKLMNEANFHITIPPEQGLAMKPDLCLPWKKLRMMKRYFGSCSTFRHPTYCTVVTTCRWMKSWGANLASEGKQRSLMKDQLSELPVECESVPFAFNLKHGGQELRPAPLAYVNDLKSLLFHLLDEKRR